MKKTRKFLNSRWALFGCGLMSYFAFAPYFCFPILWASLALLALKNREAGHKTSFLNAFSLGAGLGITGMNWLAYAMILDNTTYAWLMPVVWIGFAFFFGLYYGAAAWLASFSPSGVRRWLAFGGWFCVLEWVRSWAFSGFPWNVVGNIWNGWLPILQTVSMIGVYGLGLITVLLLSYNHFPNS